MRRTTTILLGWLLLPILMVTVLLPTPGARATAAGFGWPLRPRPPVLRRFDKPAHDWLPGHRGVDLGGAAGQPVLAAADGVVVFAGPVGAKPVVSVAHRESGLRTTYEPVTASVTVGRTVFRGDRLGVLVPGHHGCEVCLHWGALRGHEYLDPLALVHALPLRLWPVSAPAARRSPAGPDLGRRSIRNRPETAPGFAIVRYFERNDEGDEDYRGIMQAVVVLVDLFNVGPNVRTDRDYDDLLDLVGDLIRGVVVEPADHGDICDVECRLYGGFVDRRGGPTEQYVRTIRRVRRLQTLESRVRIRPTIVRSLAAHPGAQFHGTYKNGGQKMVDQMLALDAYHFAESDFFDCVGIIANDDDYVPVVVAIGHKFHCPVRWLRKRTTSPNDHHFSPENVTVLEDGMWR